MITVDELFAEDFEPAWMKKQREAEEQERREEFLKTLGYIKDRADFLWRMEAKESSLRIDAKCKGVWYHN